MCYEQAKNVVFTFLNMRQVLFLSTSDFDPAFVT